MKTRYVFLAAMLFLGLGVSGAMAQGVLVPVTGYQPVTSYYASPSYAAPSYASASYAAPSYAPPSYAAPSYVPPSYAAPTYVPPSYAAPTYVPPSYTVANYPASAVAYRPVLTPYVQPAVAYQPYVAYQRPYVVYSPVVAAGYNAPVYSTPVYTAPVAAPAGPKVWVHPKVYVEGQPIRNLLRAITP